MTPELIRLRDKRHELNALFDAIELELVDDPSWPEPSDTSYLNEKDRANPDIMANVDAMAATNALIAWFGRDMEGFVGLWRGPQGTALTDAPIVRLDTEGQYDIVARNIGEYLLITVDEDSFDEHHAAVLAAGFAPAASREEIWEALDDVQDPLPNDFRHELYNEGRIKRGLEPVEK